MKTDDFGWLVRSDPRMECAVRSKKLVKEGSQKENFTTKNFRYHYLGKQKISKQSILPFSTV